MQLFIRATQTQVVELTGSETVNDVKVIYFLLRPPLYCFLLVRLSIHCFGHSNLVIFVRISFKFHLSIAGLNAASGVFLRQLLVLYVYIFLLGILIYANSFSADASQTP